MTEERKISMAVVRRLPRYYRYLGELLQKGVTKIYINSRKAALGFYEKLGYTADFSQVSGSGEFECVMTEKELA